MKKLVLVIVLLISTIGFSQESEFKFTKNGFTDYVVVIVDTVTMKEELYRKTLDWIQITYKNPKEVLLAQIENEYIRFEGISKQTLCTKSLGMRTCFDVKYQIEVTFKDGKYKFDVLKVEQFLISQWVEFGINETNYSVFYKKNGDIKPMFSSYPENLETIFNSLNNSLKEFILNDRISTKSKDW